MNEPAVLLVKHSDVSMISSASRFLLGVMRFLVLLDYRGLRARLLVALTLFLNIAVTLVRYLRRTLLVGGGGGGVCSRALASVLVSDWFWEC